MNRLLLSKHEVKDLTGWNEVKRQMEWLNAHGYSFDVGGDGFPKVLRQHVINKLIGMSSGAFSKRVEPNWAGLKK